MRVEEAWFVAIQDSLFAWWIREAEDTMTIVRSPLALHSCKIDNKHDMGGKNGQRKRKRGVKQLTQAPY